MTAVAAVVLTVVAAGIGGLIAWQVFLEASERRHPRNPRYCGEPRCIRQAHQVGAHVDDAGRSWS